MPWRLSSLLVVALIGMNCTVSPAAEPAKKAIGPIQIDAGAVGAPMSKYIYGQFIEHLGRCIYGGIWAEMLEDRKFFDSVGAKQSPWQPVGETKVAMVKENAFVGEHTPAFAAPGGFAQGELAVRKGKQYVGRIWLKGDAAAAPVKVTLVYGDQAVQRQTIAIDRLGQEYAKTNLEFAPSGDCDAARLEISAEGKGQVFVGTVSLMPADNVQGMRADTISLLKELNAPVYRWPGGNFVSGYNWKDGIGDRDRRPPRKNPAWKGIEHNDFGIDEFMVFCHTLDTEPYIAVNSGMGDAGNAVEEVEYANGAAQTRGGAQRVANGHAEPYGVKWWGVGNEMYGNWQLGHMPLEKYVEKHNQFAEALRKADPKVHLVAVGDAGPWSERMMKDCAGHMDLISEHFYCQSKDDLVAHLRQVTDAIRHKCAAHRKYRETLDSLKGKDIRIAMDEWNYWYGPHPFGELGTRYFLKDGLGIAAGLNEYSRQSDIVFMANYAQTVNVIGALKTSKTAAAFETTGLVLKLYRQHFGTLPVKVKADAPLDVAAALSSDRKTLTVAIVNPTMEKLTLPLEVHGATLSGAGRRWQMAGNDPMAFNDPADPNKVQVEESEVSGLQGTITVDPCSVTLYSLTVE